MNQNRNFRLSTRTMIIASAVIWLVQYLFLALMFTMDMEPWRLLSDIAYPLAVVLMVPLLLVLYHLGRLRQATVSLAALVLARGENAMPT